MPLPDSVPVYLLAGEPLPFGLEEAARATAARVGKKQSLESALREEYGSTQA